MQLLLNLFYMVTLISAFLGFLSFLVQVIVVLSS